MIDRLKNDLRRPLEDFLLERIIQRPLCFYDLILLRREASRRRRQEFKDLRFKYLKKMIVILVND
jgi:hypothetical protein